LSYACEMTTKYKRMKVVKIRSGHRLVLILLVVFLVSCRPEFKPVSFEDIPIGVSQLNSDEINLDVVVINVQKKVRERLPDAYFGGLVFTGKCHDLPQLHGRIILLYIQVKQYLLEQEVLYAVATVNTDQRVMELGISDWTDNYASTNESPSVTDFFFKGIADKAYQHIVEAGLTDCDVTITQADDVWDVRCGPLENFIQECSFAINPETGEIESAKTPR
jgi:hypothetical protein